MLMENPLKYTKKMIGQNIVVYGRILMTEIYLHGIAKMKTETAKLDYHLL